MSANFSSLLTFILISMASMPWIAIADETPPLEPSVTTLAATDVTDVGAKFNGTVTPLSGSSGWANFDFGLTTSYELTPEFSGSIILINGTTTMPITSPRGGFMPSTTYYFRLRYYDYTKGKTYLGENQSFTTSAPFSLPYASSLSASSRSSTGAILNAWASAGGAAARAEFELGHDTDYTIGSEPAWFQYSGLGPNRQITFTEMAPGGSHPGSVSVGGLTPNTTYHFRLKIVSSLGTSYSPDATFTTLGPPTGLMAAKGEPWTETSTYLASSFNPQGSHYVAYFQYGWDPDNWTTIDSTFILRNSFGQPRHPNTEGFFTPQNRNILVSGLAPATAYNLRLKLVDNYGGVYYSDIATFSITSRVAPTALFSGPAVPWTPNSALLKGNISSVGGGFACNFQYGPTTAYGSTAEAQFRITSINFVAVINGFGGPGYTTSGEWISTLSGLTAGTTYHYRFTTTDYFGNPYFSDDATFTTPASPIEAWRETFFQTSSNSASSADDACPAGDGIANLMKYALGLDPSKSETTPQPTLQTFADGQALSFCFTRDRLLTDLTYEVQTADSPAGPWVTVASASNGGLLTGPGVISDSAVVVEPPPPPPPLILFPVVPPPPSPPSNLYTATVRDPITTSVSAQRFMRLNVHR